MSHETTNGIIKSYKKQKKMRKLYKSKNSISHNNQIIASAASESNIDRNWVN